ncbi:MAG: tRNA lysidine(34) synthetase TilS, partial [Methylobacillus sp.]|nr:tRNA lysidine(34) synthetase TilS [Methylobacillus sp.]
SNSLAARVEALLARAVPQGSGISVGLSGGVDSVALLHLLAQCAPQRGYTLSALHVHHGISPRADDWAAFCAALCAQLGVPLQIERVNIEPLRADLGVEAAARALRHEALARQPVDFIALAHHQNDQAETLLLQLLRGAGVKGAAAMPVLKMRAGAPALLRPLLDESRAALVEYAEQHGLRWVEDESNADDAYPRNFLRHRVMPLLEARFPGSAATLARSAGHFAEAGELLDELAERDAGLPLTLPLSPQAGRGNKTTPSPLVGEGWGEGDTFPITQLQFLSPPRAKNLLRWFLHQNGAPMPHAAQLDDMLRQLLTARGDAAVCIAWGGWQVRRYRDHVYVCRELPEPDAAFCVIWRGEEVLPLPELGGELHFTSAVGAGISQEKLRGARVSVRVRQGAERLRLDANRPSRTLKNLLQENNFPPWQRDTLPLLFCGDALIAAPGIGIEHAYRARPDEEGIVPSWDLLHLRHAM